MDTEQQIRLNFLDEAEEYFDRMESNFLGLSHQIIELQQIDLVLRSAHSIKGGAAMMGFDTLSRVAHRLEDFLKILRVRYLSSQINLEIETLLLESVDCLRSISNLNRQGVEITDSDLSQRTQPIFERLQQHLGNLEAKDEDALIAEDEDCDPALLIFEEGVETVLDRFESQFKQIGIEKLATELINTTQELVSFGKMANLEPFIQLCQSIQQHAENLSIQEIEPLADRALKLWRRSHALVLRGKVDKLPRCLEESHLIDKDTSFKITIVPNAQEVFTDNFLETDFDPLEDNFLNLSRLQAAFEESAHEIPGIIEASEKNSFAAQSLQHTSSVEQIDKMVRVPASQLKQFNTLFEQLILDRNTINLKLKQFQNVIFLMSQRISQMERSNTQLKQWYDRTSLAGFLTNQTQIPSVNPHQNSYGETNQKLGEQLRFDTLEMDSYSDIHLISQEQIETIVQLQEVATDLELGLQEITQAARNLHYTTKSMQGNVTRTQMLPFAEVVKRFPRVIRDLNVQYNKQIDLKIVGENTLLDRTVIETLSDPLMHLLRNAFDHGIEAPEVRIAAGKPASGTINIQASNQGTYTVITLSDDGGGISLERIRDRVVQMGISSSEVSQIPETELLDFIFEPGFSTAQQVTELSGRGVGMDVVRTNIQEIRGDVKVATKPGQGTTFTLKIPFTLSILRVAVIEQEGIIFAIPANSIRELIPLKSELIKTSKNTKSILWHQTEIPLIEIEKTLVYRRRHPVNLTGNPAINRNMVLVVGDEKLFAGLQISRFWHEQESTIRAIDSLISLPPGVISSVVFGDGKVISLIEPTLLLEECLKFNSIEEKDNNKFLTINNFLATKTILVVDDSINVRRYLTLTLEKAGYRVEQAKDGQEAVDKLLSGLSVQAVICDLEMPRLDGYGVLEVIKERAEFENLPIAILTSRSNEKHQKLAMNLGASAYFSKPYNEQELLDKLTKLLEPKFS